MVGTEMRLLRQSKRESNRGLEYRSIGFQSITPSLHHSSGKVFVKLDIVCGGRDLATEIVSLVQYCSDENTNNHPACLEE